MATAALTPDELKRVHAAVELRHADIRDIFAKVPSLPVQYQAGLLRLIAEDWKDDYLAYDGLHDAANRIEEVAREEDEALHGVDVGQRLPGASPWSAAQ